MLIPELFGWGTPIGLGAFLGGVGAFLGGVGVFFWGLYWLRKQSE